MNELSQPGSGALASYHPPESRSEDANRQAGTFDLAHFLQILRQWRLLILSFVVGGLALATLITVSTPPRYRATVVMEANQPKVEALRSEDQDFQQQANTFDFLTTQVGLLKSRAVAERTAQDLKLASKPALVGSDGTLADRAKAATDLVAGGVDVTAPDFGTLITLRYTGTDPALTAAIANGVADAFIETNLERRFESSNHARTFLEEQIAKTRAALEDSERKLIGYQQAQGLINTATDAGQSADVSSLQGASLVSLNEALAAATNQRVQAQAAYENARLSAQSDALASASGLRTTLANVQAEYQEKRTTLKADHPEMISLQSRTDELRKQIAREESSAANSKVAGLLAAYRAASASESRLRGQVAGLKSAVLSQRGKSVQYNILQREVDTNRSLYDALLQRYKEVGVGSGVSTPTLNVVDRAEVPRAPFAPNLTKNLLLGLGIGLLAGIGLALALEYLNDTVRTREDVRNKLKRSCLGVVPKEKKGESLIESFRDPGSGVSEAYSAILAALRFSGEKGAPKILSVTSANPSEGKSSSALALSINYARRGERVLLVDADLRRPVFKGLSNERGLTNLLASSDEVLKHISATETENLFLLPCGHIAPNPADLLSTARLLEVLSEAGAAFDRIIVDSPPVLGMADATFIASAARSVLMVVEAGKTRTRAAREAIERLEQTGAHLVGVALTKSNEEASRYGYASYRYYQAVDEDSRSMIAIAQADEA